MSSTRKIRSRISRSRGFKEILPSWIPPILRSPPWKWRFAKNNSDEFAKHLMDPEKRAQEFLKAVVKKIKC